MKFGLLIRDRKVSVVREFVAQDPQRNLEVIELGGRFFVVHREEFGSLDDPGAFEAVSSMLDALVGISDGEKRLSVLDVKAGTVETDLEHIRRLHRERTNVSRAFSLEGMRPQGGLDQEYDHGIDH